VQVHHLPSPHTVSTLGLPLVAHKRQPPVFASRGVIPTKVRNAAWRFRPRYTRSPLKFSASPGFSSQTLRLASQLIHPRPS
jgi:hypothetical protein